ncbi:MAG: MFS transporter [bacterium]
MLGRRALETKGGRLTAFSLLYLSEGIPFGFSAIALVAYLRQSGVGLTEIGLFTGSLYLPWSFKWAWGPLVDLVKLQRFGPRRFWIVISQIMMIVTLGVVMAFDPGANLKLLTLLIVIHNVFASMQDVAIDALAVEVLPEHERGLANGFMFGASYLGQAVGGSGALWMSAKFGFSATYPFVCGMLALILVFVTLRLHEPRAVVEAAEEKIVGLGAALRAVGWRIVKYLYDLYLSFFRAGPGPLVGVIVGLMPIGAVALGLGLGSTMQVDLGMTEGQIANLNIWTTVAAAIGCVAGGWISDRIGHRRMLAVWYALTTIPTFILARQFTGLSGMEGVTIPFYWKIAVAYSLTSGLISGTSMAVYMGLTAPIVAATQFTGYMALKNFVYSYSSAWQGKYADTHGYASTLFLDGWIAFLPILLFPFLLPSRLGRQEPEGVFPAPPDGGTP